jgi:hypothetical protein
MRDDRLMLALDQTDGGPSILGIASYLGRPWIGWFKLLIVHVEWLGRVLRHETRVERIPNDLANTVAREDARWIPPGDAFLCGSEFSAASGRSGKMKSWLFRKSAIS